MRIVFLGTPAFAVASLSALATSGSIDVALVVTQPDRPAGRGRTLTPPPVKIEATSLGLPVLQPETLRDDAAVTAIEEVRPDILVVVAYGEILRRNLLELAPLGCINVHPSLLPKYRGATPIPAAILAGDAITGVSIIKLVRKLDAGPILAQREANVTRDDTSASLSARLSNLAAVMLPDVVIDYAAGRIVPSPQDDQQASFTREWTTDDARIAWRQSGEHIERLVRASNPWPIAWTLIGGERFRIHSSELTDVMAPAHIPGTIAAVGSAIVVQTGSVPLRLVTVQPAGKRAMPASDWWRGLRDHPARFDDAP